MKKRWLCCALAVVLLIMAFSGTPLKVRATSSFEPSDELVAMLKKMEGFSEYPFWDNYQWTVGYGTRCPDDKLAEYKANGIPEEEAETLLKEQLEYFVSSVNNFIDTYSLELLQHQFDALVSFSYNCGTAWMRDTNRALHKAICSGDMGNAFIFGICQYSVAGGDYVLMKRRMCEANLYINGVYKAYNSGANAYPSTYKWVFLDGMGGTMSNAICGYDAADPAAPTAIFSSYPTGVDAEGNEFTYTLAGWYTADGTRVKKLDGSLEDGTVLYARWKDPEGNVVTLPKGEVVDNVKVTVTGQRVNVRSGPGTFYQVVGQVTNGMKLTIVEVYTSGSTLWGKTVDGWVCLNYTDYGKAGSDSGSDSESESDSDSETESNPDSGSDSDPGTVDPIVSKFGTVNANRVYYRSEPVISDDTVIGRMSKGDRVEIVDEYYDGSLWWGKMDTGYWICLRYVTYDSALTPGDMDGSGGVNEDDAIYLLRHVIFPADYPIMGDGDHNGDGAVNEDDAIYLLRHVIFPEDYPLSN